MIIKEVNKRDVIDLVPYELSDAFAYRYMDDLYAGKSMTESCEDAVDTFIYIAEVGHPKNENAISNRQRLSFISKLEVNAKSGLLGNGVEGVSIAMYSTIRTITRNMLASSRRLRIVKS
jgi:hypothetical protein